MDIPKQYTVIALSGAENSDTLEKKLNGMLKDGYVFVNLIPDIFGSSSSGSTARATNLIFAKY